MSKYLNILLLLFLFFSAVNAQTISLPAYIDSIPKGYISYYVDAPLKIDGKLDEAAWMGVPWTDDFVDIQGAAKPKPRFKTRVKMLWDSTYFYIGAELEEPDVWGTLKKRDTVIFYDNDFEVFMNPNGDNHEYYEMEMNALNTVWDLFLPKPYKDSGSAVDSWNIDGLKTSVHIDGTVNNPKDKDKGWTAEIAMPWKALKQYARRAAPPREGDRWRINFSRVEWQTEIVKGKYHKIKGKPEDNWVWSPQGVVDMHRPEMWGNVLFTLYAPGQVRYHPDPGWDTKRVLMRIYYAERAYHDKNKHWTSDIKDLHPGNIASTDLYGDPDIQLTPEGYTVTVLFRLPKGTVIKWHIRQDSKIWGE